MFNIALILLWKRACNSTLSSTLISGKDYVISTTYFGYFRTTCTDGRFLIYFENTLGVILLNFTPYL